MTTQNRGYAYRERLGRSAAGRSVLSYLAERYRHSSESAWRKRIEEGRVLVAGGEVDPDRKLEAGEVLVWNRPPWTEPPAPLGFAVLYRDSDLLAVAKPRGLPTMPGGGFLERTLLNRVRSWAPEASPLHRLGRGTSGLVLFARHKEARRQLTKAWQNGEVERRYRALVSGRFPEKVTLIDEPIGAVAHSLLGSVAAARASGKPARSRARLIEEREDASLVEVEIETGRTHQIRIHLAAAGHPLVGDPLYAPGGRPGERRNALPGELGYWLHAHWLRFPHPGHGRDVTLFCLPPPVLRPAGE